MASNIALIIMYPLISVRYAKDPALYFAEQLYDSMKGLGTDDNALVRVIVTRSEVAYTIHP